MASAKKNVVPMNSEVSEQLDTLRKDISTLAETVKTQAKATVADKTSTAKDVALEKTEIVKDRYQELTSKAETSIKENPLSAIAIAVGAGLLLGALTRR